MDADADVDGDEDADVDADVDVNADDDGDEDADSGSAFGCKNDAHRSHSDRHMPGAGASSLSVSTAVSAAEDAPASLARPALTLCVLVPLPVFCLLAPMLLLAPLF